MRLSKYALILPLGAGLAVAQNKPQTQNPAQNPDPHEDSNWRGTLVDANCFATRTQETQRQVDGAQTTTTTDTVTCPVTNQTNNFGLMTSEGKYIQFDPSSNAKVLEIVRTDDKLGKGVVTVVGAPQGGLAVVHSVTGDSSKLNEAERAGTFTDLGFDVDHEGDKGKLIVTATGVQWENVNRADRSAKWTFADIKEFRKDGKSQIELEPFKGKRYEFDVIGDRDAVYQAIADRIAAARPRK